MMPIIITHGVERAIITSGGWIYRQTETMLPDGSFVWEDAKSESFISRDIVALIRRYRPDYRNH